MTRIFPLDAAAIEVSANGDKCFEDAGLNGGTPLPASIRPPPADLSHPWDRAERLPSKERTRRPWKMKIRPLQDRVLVKRVKEITDGLSRLARNLWWSWDQEAQDVFQQLSPRGW